MRHLKKKTGFTAAAILLLLLLAACGSGGGGSGGGGGRQPIATVHITPDTATVKAGYPVTLTVTVNPQNTEFTVSAARGSFVTDGRQVIYTPPADRGTYELVVTAGMMGRATAQITVMEITDVNTPEDAVSNKVYGINDNDRIIMEIIDPQGRREAFLADRNGGNRTPISPPGGGDVYVFGINNSNNVLGRSDNGYFLMRTRAGRIEYVTLELTGYPGTTDFTGLDDNGRLVGYHTSTDGYVYGFIKEGTGNEPPEWIIHPDVNYAGCNDINIQPCGTYVTAINNTGQVAGYYINADGVQYGFVFDGNGFTPVNHPDTRPGNPINVHVGGINDSGKVVGASWGADFHARGFMADGGDFTFVEHPDAVKATEGGSGTFLTGINNSDQLAGWFDDGGARARGFLMANP